MFLFIFIFLICFLYSSEIKVYFTSPNNTPSIENPFKGIDFALKEFIDSANFGDTIYLCIYQINNSTITSAIDDAVRRKVKVYAIFDDKTSLDLFATNFERKKMPSDIVMHNKFVVLKSSKVWSGSYNFTVSATYSQNNFALEIFSKELAEIYEKA
ncbi:MAG: phospholipase D-like domain-containing protein, partial [Candidatus Anstonellales archaeon]